MSSYLNNLLTNTTSRYNSLRRQLLSDEGDGDTEDDSHISRVLRAYYTEKGRPFPPWLPPDPKAPQSAPTQFVSSAGRQPAQQPLGGRVAAGGLSDLWDSPSQAAPQQQPQSLRRGLGRGGPAMQGRPGMGNSLSPEPQAQGRPLPSQRAGSYQSNFAPPEPSPPPSAGSGSTAQERLKARLWGGARSTSPSQASSANTSPAGTPAPGGLRDRSRGPGGGSRPPYPDERGGRPPPQQQSSYGMSASAAPGWDYDPYAPDNYGGAGQQPAPRERGGRVGLPSGPRMR